MRQLRLIIRYAVWLVVFASAGCGRKSVSQVVGGSPLAQSPSMLPTTSATQSPAIVPSVTPSPEAKPGQTASVDLPKLEKAVQPSVILVTVFDPKGNLLRTQSGFFISADGRFVTTARAIEGGVNAVAKTGDGGIYNVTGIVAASKESDLAVLQADVKRAPFLALHKNGNLSSAPGIVMIGSALAGNDGSARQTKITAHFFFQAENGIRDLTVTGVQTCALPISCMPTRKAPTCMYTSPACRWTRIWRHACCRPCGCATTPGAGMPPAPKSCPRPTTARRRSSSRYFRP